MQTSLVAGVLAWLPHVQLAHFLIVSALLFALGLYGVVTRRNAIMVLMGVELILNAANINLIAFSRYGGIDSLRPGARRSGRGDLRDHPRRRGGRHRPRDRPQHLQPVPDRECG